MILLPRKNKDGEQYLSYSQISTWKRGKSEYFKQYFYGERGESSAFMEFGKMVGDALEIGDFSSFTKKEQEFLNTIPRLDEFEREVRLDLKGYHVIGYIDTNSSDLKNIIDYKSGTESKVDVYKSDEYNQLDIYSAAILQKDKVLPSSAKVILYDRVGSYGNFKVGEKYWVIDKKITKKRLKEVTKEIEGVAKDISRHYQAFLLLNK